MLTERIRAAMHCAVYEILSDGICYGEVPGFQGVYSNAASLEECRSLLQEVPKGWIVLGLRLGHRLATVDAMEWTAGLEVA